MQIESSKSPRPQSPTQLKRDQNKKYRSQTSEAGGKDGTICIPTCENLLTQRQLKRRGNAADYQATCANPCDPCKVSQNSGRQPTVACKFLYLQGRRQSKHQKAGLFLKTWKQHAGVLASVITLFDIFFVTLLQTRDSPL